MLFFLFAAFASRCAATDRQQPPHRNLVEVQGLHPSYSSCSVVRFFLHNTSDTEVYAEVYIENFDAGSWRDDTFPYNLHTPISLYQKTVLTQTDELKSGESWAISYDRCLQPTFVKEEKTVFRKAITEKDASAKSPILQRIRIDIYEVGLFQTDSGRETSRVKNNAILIRIAFAKVPGVRIPTAIRRRQ